MICAVLVHVHLLDLSRFSILSGFLAIPQCSTLDRWKVFLEIVAWFAASLFILYKLVTGYYFHPDMSVKVVAKRGPKHISACLTVKKGDRGGIELHDARVVLCNFLGQPFGEDRVFVCIRRYGFDPERASFRVKFQEHETDPMLLIVPGDEMQFSTFFEVQSPEPFIVNAVVLGRQVLVYKGFFASWTKKALLTFWARKTLLQWHASAVSLPTDSGDGEEG